MSAAAISAPSLAATCPACESCRASSIEHHGPYEILRCAACGLQFSNPMSTATAHYASAYDRCEAPPEVAGEGLPFLRWTEEGSQFLPEYESFLTSAQQSAMAYIRREFPPGSIGLELGFGAGWFLGALRAAGLQPFGIEVADPPVAAVAAKGFTVTRSDDGTLPSGWPQPDVIFAFEVVEHLPDPLSFLNDLQRKFPSALVIVSVPDERRWFLLGGREAHDYPPNHLTRWSRPALQKLFSRAGYAEVEVLDVRPTAQELSMASLGRFVPGRNRGEHAAARAAVETPSTTLPQELRKRRLRRWLAHPAALALGLGGWTACSMLVIARSR